jgi:hypothetical protein
VPQPLPRFQADEERAADAAKIKGLLAELGQDDVPPELLNATAGGDSRRLRGIPAIGRGCPGAIRGSDPISALMSNGNGRRR